MSIAQTIAAQLGEECPAGSDWKCRCPVCGGRLALRDGDRGLMAKCWGGCESRDVYAELRGLGYLTADPPPPLSPEEIARRAAAAQRERRRKIAEARWLWDTGSPIKDTLGDTYLRARGLDVFSAYLSDRAASALRFLPRTWHSPGIFRPAIVAAIEHVGHGFIGAHVTYLAIDGSGKAALDPPRKIFGACGGGAVRLGEPQRGKWLCIGEGVETALAVAQSCCVPGWAALSAGGIRALVLPPEALSIVICGDNDRNGVGQRAAYKAAERFLAEGREVRVFIPSVPGTDWDDVLLGKAPARRVETNHAA